MLYLLFNVEMNTYHYCALTDFLFLSLDIPFTTISVNL